MGQFRGDSGDIPGLFRGGGGSGAIPYSCKVNKKRKFVLKKCFSCFQISEEIIELNVDIREYINTL